MDNLSDDVLLDISSQCNLHDLLQLTETNRRLSTLINSSDHLWKSLLKSYEYITATCSTLTEARAQQYCCTSYFDDCKTWKRLFQKIYLTNRNWDLGRCEVRRVEIEHTERWRTWHIKLDPIKKCLLLTNEYGGLKFVDFDGNTLYRVPANTGMYPHCEFDGTFMAFVNDTRELEIWKRQGKDSFEFKKIYSIGFDNVSDRTDYAPRCYRMKDGYLLLACYVRMRHGYFSKIFFLNLEKLLFLDPIFLEGSPSYVEFDNDFFYIATIPNIPTGEYSRWDEECPRSLWMLYKFEPIHDLHDHQRDENINHFVLPAFQIRDWGNDYNEFRRDLFKSLDNKYVNIVIDNGQEEPVHTIHVDVMNRQRDDNIMGVFGPLFFHISNKSCLVNVARKHRELLSSGTDPTRRSSSQINSSSDESFQVLKHKERNEMFMRSLFFDMAHFALANGPLAVCNNSAVLAGMNREGFEPVPRLYIFGNIERTFMIELPYFVELETSNQINTIMMDDTLCVANLAGNTLVICDFSAHNFLFPPKRLPLFHLPPGNTDSDDSFDNDFYGGGDLSFPIRFYDSDDPDGGGYEFHGLEVGEYETDDLDVGLYDVHDPEAGEYETDLEGGRYEVHDPEAGEYETDDLDVGLYDVHDPEAGEYETDLEGGRYEVHDPEAGEYETDDPDVGGYEIHDPEVGEYETDDPDVGGYEVHDLEEGEYETDDRDVGGYEIHDPEVGEYEIDDPEVGGYEAHYDGGEYAIHEEEGRYEDGYEDEYNEYNDNYEFGGDDGYDYF